MNAKIVAEFVVFSNGQVDEQASLMKFAQSLSNYMAESASFADTILLETNKFFDENYGARVPCDYFAMHIIRALGANVQNYHVLEEHVHKFVFANKGEIGSGALLHIQKGKNGGIARLSEVRTK